MYKTKIAPRAIAFFPDGQMLAVGGGNRTGEFSIRLLDIEKFGVKGVLEGHESFVSPLEFSQNGNHVVSASYDGTVRLWQVNK